MRQYKMTIGLLGLASCIITLFIYYWHRSCDNYTYYLPQRIKVEVAPSLSDEVQISMRYVPLLDEVFKGTKGSEMKQLSTEEASDESSTNFIDTPGCQIPMSTLNFRKHINKDKIAYCGRRAVFLKKISSHKVQVLININQMKKYLRKNVYFYCCYRFIKTSIADNTNIDFTKCKKIESGDFFLLETDFVNVKCFESETNQNDWHEIYDDVYAFIKKHSKQTSGTTCHKKPYNILMLGMDTMSLARVTQTMPQTTKYFQENFWLKYRGYHKVGDNTFPNLMAALTGQNLSTLFKRCAKKMDKCNDLLIWSQFKKAGYATAYGEDYLRLPDTFSKNYAFTRTPTDHFIRPLFLKGETERNSTVCSGKLPAGQQILDYALDFALTYRFESFFGVFWMNSFSHNIHSRPENADKMFENFFKRLTYTGVLDNTFLIFFSDHGVRFGTHRMSIESYYDERLPMLFIHVPQQFKITHFEELKTLSFNQYRLVTPYDLYNTLIEIHELSVCSDVEISQAKACPMCHSIFSELSANRTCQDVSISQKWCSCHKVFPLQINDSDATRSVMQMVRYIQTLVRSVKTKRCWSCMALKLKNIIRIHYYMNKSNASVYHDVVALTMYPGNVSYEAIVLRNETDVQLVGSISAISPYKGLGKCTINRNDRLFCVCQVIGNCKHRNNH